MQVEGKVIYVGEVTVHGNNGFRKRELVIETEEQYPQKLLIEFNQDKCDVLDAVSVGQKVKVSINLRGRDWINPQGETKYFNTIQGWRVEVLGVSNSAPQQQQQQQQQQPFKNEDAYHPQTNLEEEDENDLPF